MHVTVGSVHFTPEATARLARLLTTNSSTKGTAASILNRQGVQMVNIAARIARDELRERPASRRTRESLAHGDSYRNSFKIIPARESGYVIQVAVGSTHPFARAVEHGTSPHPIEATNTKRLAFPFAGPGLGGGPGFAGRFAVTSSEAPTAFPSIVNHPGATAHHVLARAVAEWKAHTSLRRR